MKLIDLIKKNIKAADYKFGKSVRGKGLEIFLPDTNTLFGHRDYSLENKFFTKEEAAKQANLIFLKVGKESSKFYIKFNFGETKFDIGSKEKLASMLTKHSSFSLYEKARKIGYIKVRNYDKSYKSQCKLIKDLTKLDGYDTYEEIIDGNYDTFDGIRELKGSKYSNYYTMGEGYDLVTGENLVWKAHDDASHIDTRLDYYNEVIVNNFWCFGGMEELGDSIKRVDPDEEVTVYHRKGKDFYVAPSLTSVDCYVSYLLEDQKYEQGDCEEDYIAFLCSKSDIDTKIETIVSIIENTKREIEMKGYIYNQFNSQDEDVANLLYEEIDDFRNEVMENIQKWNSSTIEDEFFEAYHKIVDKKTKVLDDKTIEVAYTPFEFGNEEPYTKKFNHLKKVERFGKVLGFEIVHSSIGTSETKAYAIKKDNEEYHFDILYLIAKDISGEQTLKEAVEDMLAALEKRKIEMLTQKELFEKASHVFVGIEDSLNSGNCQFGTKEFIARNGIDTSKIGGIRGDELLKMEMSNFTKRTVVYALAHHNKNAVA